VSKSEIPQSPQDITANWLDRTLRQEGVLSSGTITGFDLEVIGTDIGFTGSLARLSLRYDSDETDGPATLIAKFPTLIAKNRGAMEIGQGYVREIRFYETFASRLRVRVPRCYHGAMGPGSNGETGLAVVGWIEKLPLWLLGPISRLFMWLGSRSKRRYVLLLEDMAAARPGDQLEGCDRAGAERPIRALAAIHASHWNDPTLDDHTWLPTMALARRLAHAAFLRGRPGFLKKFSALLPASMAGLAEWFDDNGPRMMQKLAEAPRTLAHGDYRLDNLFFDDSYETPGGVAVIDWQSPFRGPGVFDLAYFNCTNMRAEVTAEQELDSVEFYHRELVAGGVSDYTLDDCIFQYELSKLVLAYRIIAGLELLDLGEGRGADLANRIVRRTYCRLPRGPYERFIS